MSFIIPMNRTVLIGALFTSVGWTCFTCLFSLSSHICFSLSLFYLYTLDTMCSPGERNIAFNRRHQCVPHNTRHRHLFCYQLQMNLKKKSVFFSFFIIGKQTTVAKIFHNNGVVTCDCFCAHERLRLSRSNWRYAFDGNNGFQRQMMVRWWRWSQWIATVYCDALSQFHSNIVFWFVFEIMTDVRKTTATAATAVALQSHAIQRNKCDIA